MTAIRFRNHKTQQPPSLYWSEFAGRTLNQKFEGMLSGPTGISAHSQSHLKLLKSCEPYSDLIAGHPDGPNIVNREATFGPETRIGRHTIIASEPTTYDEKEWHLIGKNCTLTVDEFGTETEIPIDYDEALNATDPGSSA
jgi:glutamine amidotransferase